INSDVLKSGVGKLAEITQPFVPLISPVFIIVSEAVKIYENAKHNKNICASLLMRVNIARTNKKYALANSVHETFIQLISEFDKSMDDLHFMITISNEQQRKLDQENLNYDIEEMKQSHINTVINKVQIINKKVDHLIHDPINNMINFKAVKINPKELDDLPNTETKKSIVKKLYRVNDVACKFTNIIDNETSG
ncbi:13430_t:CDS:2, partial [Racocetra fulgida]